MADTQPARALAKTKTRSQRIRLAGRPAPLARGGPLWACGSACQGQEPKEMPLLSSPLNRAPVTPSGPGKFRQFHSVMGFG